MSGRTAHGPNREARDELGRDRVAVYKVDVTDREQVKAFVDFGVETFGRIDVIINNAGLMPLSNYCTIE